MTDPYGAPSAYSALGRQDLHAHTTFSDGDLPLEEVVEVARSRGVKIGIADHVSSRNKAVFVSSRDALERYLRALDRDDIFRSAELCWCDAFAMDVAAELAGRVDYLIGSNHGFALPDGSFPSPWSTRLPDGWAHRPGEVMESMVSNLCDLVRTMPIAVVAHSTLLPAVLRQLDGEIHAWWTEEREDRFIEAVVDAGVAIEISSRYRLPHDRLLTKAREAGARFSLGSDGHHRHQLANLDWAVEAAVRNGIGDEHLFIPRSR